MSLLFVVGVAMLALFAVWVAALVEVINTADGYPAGSQLVWVLVLLLGGPIGLILYGLLGRPDVAGRHRLDRRPRRPRQHPSTWLR
jgi:hypothetical protein